MKPITRRALLLGAIITYFFGCKVEDDSVEEIRINLGPVISFKDVYAPFTAYRVAIIKSNEGGKNQLKAVSLVCSHQACLINQIDHDQAYFKCPCHGSLFTKKGDPISGPAKTPLTWLKLSIQDGDLILHPRREVDESWVLEI